MMSVPRGLVSTSLATVFLAATLAMPGAGAQAQTQTPQTQTPQTQTPQTQTPATSAPLGSGSYHQDAPPSGNAAMSPLAAPQAKPKPKGGCLKYGAAGAVGGHLAHHHAVLGAMGGCAVGMYVKHRSKKSIAATGHP